MSTYDNDTEYYMDGKIFRKIEANIRFRYKPCEMLDASTIDDILVSVYSNNKRKMCGKPMRRANTIKRYRKRLYSYTDIIKYLLSLR